MMNEEKRRAFMGGLPDDTQQRCDDAVHSLFPDCTPIEYYGAAIHLDADFNIVAVTCGGVRKEMAG